MDRNVRHRRRSRTPRLLRRLMPTKSDVLPRMNDVPPSWLGCDRFFGRPFQCRPAPSVIALPPPRALEEDGSLQALEDHIRDQLPSLPSLSPSRYTAQIAAWVGRVRLNQSGPDGERTRIASRIMFDKLPNLAGSMEAGPIEGLNLSWSTRNWERYIQDNELIAGTPDVLPPQMVRNVTTSHGKTSIGMWRTPPCTT